MTMIAICGMIKKKTHHVREQNESHSYDELYMSPVSRLFYPRKNLRSVKSEKKLKVKS